MAIAARLTFKLSAHAPYRNRQVPFLKRRAVAQCTRFAGEHRQIMQRIIDRLAATEGAFMLADDLAILPAFQPVRVGPDLHGATDRAGVNGVAVIVKTDQASLGYRCRDRVESVKRTNVWHQT